MINLKEAARTGRIEDFIKQEEARGVPPVDSAELKTAIERLVKPHRSEDRTSRFASRDGSNGK